VLIMEMEGGEGGSEVCRVDGSGVCQISGISAGEFRVVRAGSHSGAASPEGVDCAEPLWSVDWKVMWFLDQSINGLYCCSQLYPRTAKQEESSNVT
jgi:hypothetical protein